MRFAVGHVAPGRVVLLRAGARVQEQEELRAAQLEGQEVGVAAVALLIQHQAALLDRLELEAEAPAARTAPVRLHPQEGVVRAKRDRLRGEEVVAFVELHVADKGDRILARAGHFDQVDADGLGVVEHLKGNAGFHLKMKRCWIQRTGFTAITTVSGHMLAFFEGNISQVYFSMLDYRGKECMSRSEQ